MKIKKHRRKAAAAIRRLIEAAKELQKIEQEIVRSGHAQSPPPENAEDKDVNTKPIQENYHDKTEPV